MSSIEYFCVMPRVISYLLLAQMLYFVGAKSVVILNWKVNQDIITEKYCVNKDKPMMNCDGKCKCNRIAMFEL